MNKILQKRIKEEAFQESSVYDTIQEMNVAYIAGMKMATFALQNQWISTKEALPEEEFDDGYKFVFVIVKIDEETSYYDTDYIRNGKWELHDADKVTYWMPIPSLEGGEK